MKEWYEEHFQEDYLKIYAHRNETKAGAELNKLLEFIPNKVGQKALDLCCGQGRHSRWLARHGFHVVGIDLSTVLLQNAIEFTNDLPVSYMRADVRNVPFIEEMDLVVNLFTSFGYFTDDDENEEVFTQVSKALKNEGYFLFDYLNPTYVRNNLVPESSSVNGNLLIKEKRQIDNSYVKKQIIIQEGSSIREYTEQVKLYELDQLMIMLERNKLKILHVFGDYDVEKYDKLSSPRIIILAQKQDF